LIYEDIGLKAALIKGRLTERAYDAGDIAIEGPFCIHVLIQLNSLSNIFVKHGIFSSESCFPL